MPEGVANKGTYITCTGLRLQALRFVFTELNTEKHFDTVTFNDTETSKLLGNYSGYVTNLPIVPEMPRKITVTFRSDAFDFDARNGFIMIVTFVGEFVTEHTYTY